MKKTIFATANGVVVQSGDKKVISAINCDGRKQLRSYKTKNKIVFWHYPFFRGIQYFFCGIFAFLQALRLSIDLCQPTIVKEKDLQKYYKKNLIVVAVVSVISVLVSAVLLGFLPGRIGWWLVDYRGSNLLRNVVIMSFKILFFYVLMLCLRFFPGVVDLFRFNRAGDIVLSESLSSRGLVFSKSSSNAASKKAQKTASVQKNTLKKHLDATNFLNFVVFVFILDFVVVTLWGASFGFWYNFFFHIALLLFCTGVGYEILWLLNKCPYLSWICYVTACLVYAKPSKTHIETVSVAVSELNLLTSQKEREFMKDDSKRAFSLVYNEVRNKLAVAGVNDKSDADWIIATVLGKNRAEIKLVQFVTDKQYQDILKATERRAKGESIDNIFGWTEFFGLRIEVNKKVLTPRMETELLVEQVLKAQKNYKKPTILDLGTGSGAIAISIAKNCDAQVTAVDVSKVALVTAESNAKKNDVNIEFLHSNLFDGLKRKRKFDIIVSNPPYIPTAELPTLDKNVRECDPELALDGGDDGLDFYREISRQATARLNNGGMIFYEIGKGQASDVRKILRENGFEEIKTIKDYNKIERIVCGKLR